MAKKQNKHKNWVHLFNVMKHIIKVLIGTLLITSSMKQGSLFCFVLFCQLMPRSPKPCLVSLEGSLMSSGVHHGLCLRLFGAMMWETMDY